MAIEVPDVVIEPLSAARDGLPSRARSNRADPSILFGVMKIFAIPRLTPPCAVMSAVPDASS